MSRWKAAALACAICVAGSVACTGDAGSDTPSASRDGAVLIERHPDKPPPGRYGVDVQFRTGMGLDASLAHIRAVHELARTHPERMSSAGWGALITRAEERQIFHRGRLLTDNADAVRRWTEDHPDSYAGGYSDQGIGSFVVLVLDDPEGVLADLRQVVPHPDMVSTREVDITQGQGNALADEIIFDQDHVLADAGVVIPSGGFDAVSQRVELDVKSPLGHAADVLAEHYPPELLEVHPDPGFMVG